MSRRLIMAASALFLGAIGFAATFLPHEIVRGAGGNDQAALPVALQLAGALYLGFAILNWTARESPIGGIYSRPIALGNLLHFFAGAMSAIKGFNAIPRSAAGLSVTAGYVLFALAFGWVFFTSPVKAPAAPAE